MASVTGRFITPRNSLPVTDNQFKYCPTVKPSNCHSYLAFLVDWQAVDWIDFLEVGDLICFL